MRVWKVLFAGPEEVAERSDIGAFALGLCRRRLRLLHLRPRALHGCVVGAAPDLMELAHRHSPVRHRARRVGLDDRLKLPLRLRIPEVMQQRDAAIERRLRRWQTGDRERDHAELFREGIGGCMGWSIDIWATAGNAVRVSRESASIFIAVDYKSGSYLLAKFSATAGCDGLPTSVRHSLVTC